MSRPLVVSFLLLATIANAAVSTKYSCGYTTGCDDCVENKAASPVTQELGKCVPKGTSYYTYECSAGGKVQEVEYYDAQCKIQKGSPSDENDFACKPSSNYASLEVTGEKAFYCQGSYGCSGSCIPFDIKSASGGCTDVDGKSYKAKQLATGNAVLFISGYSSTGCQPRDLLFQGEFVAGSCTPLSEMTTYKCDAPTHVTTKTCGLVESCSACSEATETEKTLYGKCVNQSTSSHNASYKRTCSDGKVTKTSFTDDQCTEQETVTTTESCVYSNTMQYAKLSGATLYICDSMKGCSDTSSCSSTYTPSTSLDTTGKCVYDAKKGFSYKATKNGDRYRIAAFGDKKCQKNLQIQGDFTLDKCVAVRTATKTVCGTFAATTMLAASVIVAAMSLLLF